MKDRSMSVNVYNGGQFISVHDNAIGYVTQNNGVFVSELDNIIKEIMENLSSLEKEKANEIINVVNMAKVELEKPKPEVGKLKNCVTSIAPMFTIANGIPTLANNLQKLLEYIKPFIY